MRGPRRKPEPVQAVKQRRDATLRALVEGVPYIRFLGIAFERKGDELTAVLPFDPKLIGNPLLPAIHGGVTAAFLEVTAIITLSWTFLWEDVESGTIDTEQLQRDGFPGCPKRLTFPLIICDRACRAMPMPVHASTGPGGGMHRYMSRRGRTTAAVCSRRPQVTS